MTLWYNAQSERYGVLDEADEWNIDGLHCGACFDIAQGDAWLPVRLEYAQGKYAVSRGWYLIGENEKALKIKPDGLKVRL